jgi:DIS3-like exonuclease 2
VSSVQETSETPPSSVVSLGYNSNEELLGSPNGSRSCLLGSSYSSPRRSGTDGNQPGSTSVHSTSPAKLYLEHWSPEVVNRAMEEGRVFGATLRVNSHNRNEAYVTIDGIPRDVLIDGSAAQNRAMEGDSVAVLLEQPSAWPRLKGGNNKLMSNEPRGLGEVVQKHSEAEKEIVQLSSRLGDNVPSSDGMQEQHALGLSSTDQAESMVRDLGANASVPQLQQRSKDVHHLNYIQKDPGVSGSPYWQESSTIKASICSTGQLDRRAEATHKMILQSPRRPSNESAPGQNGLESKKEMGEGQQLSGGSGSVLALKQTENNVGVRCSNNADTNGKVATALANVVSLVMSLPGKRPAGKVVAILEKSFRWETVVGFLELPARAGSKCGPGRSHAFNVDDSPRKRRNLMLVPVDNRCPKMMVSDLLPDDIRQRLWDGDSTVSNELLAARVVGWQADSHFPVAVVKQSLGQGGELEAQQRAILLEHAISSGKFSPASLACLPELPWKIPVSEMKRRKNLFHLRVFSVVRSTAQDCAHALSIESLPDGAVRVGMHVADVSYFVHPGTALDQEAQMRSTSVSCVQEVLPMLPHVLCKDLCSLNPAVDRLAFSVMWDMNDVGDITNEWIGRTVVHSCAKLTHGHVQTMMDEVFPDFEGIEPREDMLGFETELPQIYGGHTWMDLVMDVCALHRIATKRRASRFEGGALKLDQSKLVFALEEDGTPYESTMYNAKDSNLVVKEFMLLANTTVAHVISNAFPDSALLCCCPKPSPRKLKEFEDFCCKIGIDLDASSAGALSISLRNMQESVKHDPVLYSILMQYAAKPMQSTKYFCSREFKEKEKWAHCRHAIPLYTHFTSPMQRYPDIIVHRTLAAALEAEEVLGNMAVFMPLTNSNQTRGILAAEKSKLGVPTETSSERGANSMPVSQWVLTSVTMKHQLRGSSELISLAAWCNQRRMASRTVKEASIKLNICTMLKKNKQGLLSNARVLALGPKFMSLYICKFAMERRIYYEDIEGVTAEWFEATGTLVLDISSSKNTSQRRANQSRNGKPQRTVADIAMLVNPTDSSSSSPEQESFEDIIREVQERLAGKVFTDDAPEISGGADQLASNADIEPTVFPLTLRSLSSVPVSLHAIGGDNRPLDVAARLYVSSYATSG